MSSAVAVPPTKMPPTCISCTSRAVAAGSVPTTPTMSRCASFWRGAQGRDDGRAVGQAVVAERETGDLPRRATSAACAGGAPAGVRVGRTASSARPMPTTSATTQRHRRATAQPETARGRDDAPRSRGPRAVGHRRAPPDGHSGDPARRPGSADVGSAGAAPGTVVPTRGGRRSRTPDPIGATAGHDRVGPRRATTRPAGRGTGPSWAARRPVARAQATRPLGAEDRVVGSSAAGAGAVSLGASNGRSLIGGAERCAGSRTPGCLRRRPHGLVRRHRAVTGDERARPPVQGQAGSATDHDRARPTPGQGGARHRPPSSPLGCRSAAREPRTAGRMRRTSARAGATGVRVGASGRRARATARTPRAASR